MARAVPDLWPSDFWEKVTESLPFYRAHQAALEAMHAHPTPANAQRLAAASALIASDTEARVLRLGDACPGCGQKTPCAHFHSDYFCPVCAFCPCKCADPAWLQQEAETDGSVSERA